MAWFRFNSLRPSYTYCVSKLTFNMMKSWVWLYRHYVTYAYHWIHACIANITTWFTCSVITSAMAKVMFSPFSIGLSVSLSVCLLATLREKGWTDFQDRWDLVHRTFCNILAMLHLILYKKNFFQIFRGNRCLLATLQNNGWGDFHEILAARWLWDKGHSRTFLGCCINTLMPRQNGRHLPDIFKCIFLNENVWISFQISLKFVRKGSINNILALVQIMAWRRLGDKPLSEPMMIRIPTHICVTRPQ